MIWRRNFLEVAAQSKRLHDQLGYAAVSLCQKNNFPFDAPCELQWRSWLAKVCNVQHYRMVMVAAPWPERIEQPTQSKAWFRLHASRRRFLRTYLGLSI